MKSLSFTQIKIFILAFGLCLILWTFLGFFPSMIIGTNDIAHHLLTLHIGKQTFPFFTPIYDWLWMGGSLVAPNVGYNIFERLLLFLGVPLPYVLSLFILFFQATIFSFVFDLLKQKRELRFFEGMAFSLSLAFFPLITTRIIYGHMGLYLPVFFPLFLFWLLRIPRVSYFLLVLAMSFMHVILCGPYFQVLFYGIVLVSPFLLVFYRRRLKERALIVFLSFAIPFFFSLDFLVLTFQYFFSGDIFRNVHSGNLLYSYAKMTILEFPDMVLYQFLNLRELPFFFLHETKVFLGVIPFLFLFEKHRFPYWLKWGIFLFLCAFIFAPFSLDSFFSSVPLLNMFRIPQRIFLAFIPLLYIIFFLQLSKVKKEMKIPFYFWPMLVLYYVASIHVPFVADGVLILLVMILFFKKKDIVPREIFSWVFLVSNIAFLSSFPTLFTDTSHFEGAKKELRSLERKDIVVDDFWLMNKSRLNAESSAFGYTHPLRPYKELYQTLFDHSEIDQLYFSPLQKPGLSSFLNVYRYGEKTLSYSPTELTKDKGIFFRELQNKKQIALTQQTSGNCGHKLIVANEKVENGNLFFDLDNQTEATCLVVVPFNYSAFLHAKSDNKTLSLFPANMAQLSFEIPSGKHKIELGTQDAFYWKCKILGSFLSFLLFVFLICQKRKSLF